MSDLTSFFAPANAVVIGAGGGIGAAFTVRLQDEPRVAHVDAFARSGTQVPLDLEDEDSIAAAAQHAGDALDLVIVSTGLLHDPDVQPEKSLRQLDGWAMQRLFAVNTTGPALVAKHFLPRMRKQHKTVFAVLSARVGSIGDNRLGGWISYRASKAALNMIVRTCAIEQSRTRPQCIVAGLHPGTVDTRLSAPFSGRVPAGKLFSADQSAGLLLAVIDGLDTGDTGGFFAWDGQPVEF